MMWVQVIAVGVLPFFSVSPIKKQMLFGEFKRKRLQDVNGKIVWKPYMYVIKSSDLVIA